MGLWDILVETVLIERTYQNIYYIGIILFSLAALIIVLRSPNRRLYTALWVSSGLICLLWEITLWITGIRQYNGFGIGDLELLLHAVTEAGPGLIFMVMFSSKVGIIDISSFAKIKGDQGGGK
ncbi:MAG: hypothetical protein JW939_03445 [Candidatus Thermoplasmatota archaeon]|nr:hypothetical protein [Candidatus Thermoplasmatota archaeon]